VQYSRRSTNQAYTYLLTIGRRWLRFSFARRWQFAALRFVLVVIGIAILPGFENCPFIAGELGWSELNRHLTTGIRAGLPLGKTKQLHEAIQASSLRLEECE